MFFYTAASVLVPLAVGWLIEGSSVYGWFGGERNNAYRAVAACVCALTVISSAIVRSGRFPNPPKSRFLYFRFHWLWYKMLWLGVLKGMAQGYIVTLPAMLILLLVGQEGMLGTVQAAGGMLSAFLLYLVGRLAAPRHRIHVLAAGLLLFVFGGLVNAIRFDAAGVLILTACLLLSKPLLDVAYFPIQFGVTDRVSAIEGKGQFAYIFNHECGEYAGRVIGCGLFIVFAHGISAAFALKYALPIIGVLQLLSLVLVRRMLGETPAAAPAGGHFADIAGPAG
jgi:YQGE family putative transporter